MTRLARRSGRAPDHLGLLLALACWALVACWAALVLCPSDQPAQVSRVQRGPGLAVQVPCNTTSTGYPFEDPPVHELVLGWLRGDPRAPANSVVLRADGYESPPWCDPGVVAVVESDCKHAVVTRCAVQGCDPATCDLSRCWICGERR